MFGIGSMIYSGLSMGQYFEMPPLDECTNILVVVTPGLRLAFTFVQMYFIFLNASVRTIPVHFYSDVKVPDVVKVHSELRVFGDVTVTCSLLM